MTNFANITALLSEARMGIVCPVIVLLLFTQTYPAGTFVKFSSTTWLSPFRAYLLLSSTSGAKSAIMEMAIDNTTTGITSISDAPAAHTPYYNIEGMKVESPSHGIYIHNGHKVIMK